MKWTIIQRNPPLVQMDGTNRTYTFVPKNHVAMAWVSPDDVGKLLVTRHKVCNCNNGTYREAFELASRLDVLLHENNSRDGQLPEGYTEVV